MDHTIQYMKYNTGNTIQKTIHTMRYKIQNNNTNATHNTKCKKQYKIQDYSNNTIHTINNIPYDTIHARQCYTMQCTQDTIQKKLQYNTYSTKHNAKKNA